MEEVVKNLSDQRCYQIIRLPNNINCLLISDKGKIVYLDLWIS